MKLLAINSNKPFAKKSYFQHIFNSLLLAWILLGIYENQPYVCEQSETKLEDILNYQKNRFIYIQDAYTKDGNGSIVSFLE